MDLLPPEIHIKILLKLDVLGLCRLSQANMYWRTILGEDFCEFVSGIQRYVYEYFDVDVCIDPTDLEMRELYWYLCGTDRLHLIKLFTQELGIDPCMMYYLHINNFGCYRRFIIESIIRHDRVNTLEYFMSLPGFDTGVIFTNGNLQYDCYQNIMKHDSFKIFEYCFVRMEPAGQIHCLRELLSFNYDFKLRRLLHFKNYGILGVLLKLGIQNNKWKLVLESESKNVVYGLFNFIKTGKADAADSAEFLRQLSLCNFVPPPEFFCSFYDFTTN